MAVLTLEELAYYSKTTDFEFKKHYCDSNGRFIIAYTLFFVKNQHNENIEAEIARKIRTI